jgi:hypothetical protein
VQRKSSKELHSIVIEFPKGATRVVKVKATSREKAEERALKFNPTAIGVKR